MNKIMNTDEKLTGLSEEKLKNKFMEVLPEPYRNYGFTDMFVSDLAGVAYFYGQNGKFETIMEFLNYLRAGHWQYCMKNFKSFTAVSAKLYNDYQDDVFDCKRILERQYGEELRNETEYPYSRFIMDVIYVALVDEIHYGFLRKNKK